MQLGILGGTFDPVHNGHIHIARKLLELVNLDQILFMVANYPPHKGQTMVTDAYHRFAMVAIRLLEEPKMIASGVELNRNGPSYTIDTLKEFRRIQPESKICFIAGSDSLQEIHGWRNCDEIFDQFCLIFVQRPGAKADLADLKLDSEYRNRIKMVGRHRQLEIEPGTSYFVELDAPPYSSSEIRKAIALGRSLPTDSLSPPVLSYIRKHHLYEQK